MKRKKISVPQPTIISEEVNNKNNTISAVAISSLHSSSTILSDINNIFNYKCKVRFPGDGFSERNSNSIGILSRISLPYNNIVHFLFFILILGS
jgi:hypothetical protein